MKSDFSNQLTPSQRQAVFHGEGPLLVIAGPGSGKTRVITYRIAALVDAGISPHNICAITFTNKAAEEMRLRCAGLLGFSAPSRISTFHSLCVRILRQYSEQAKVNSNFTIFDAADQAKCIKQAINVCELDTTNFSPSRMLEAVSSLKNRLVNTDLMEQKASDFFSKVLAKIYTSYQNILSQANALDFDDLLMNTAFLLRDNPDVRTELGNRFKFLLIDEYQDTNHAQYQIAKQIASIHNNICATGDPDQSIYRWRGADIRNILAFEKDWPNATVVKLEENFRSTPNILTAADKLISNNSSRKLKVLIPTRPSGSDISISCCDSEQDEAAIVASQIKQLIDSGLSYRDIAVFYRINSASRVLEEVFIRNKIPYQIVRGVEFYSRREIRDLLAYLKILVNPADSLALLRIINTPARGIGKTTIDKIQSFASAHKISLYEALKLSDKIDSLSAGTKAKIKVFVTLLESFKKDINGPVAPLADRIFKDSGLAVDIKDSDELDNITELISAAAAYDQNAENPSLLDYLQQISLYTDADSYDASGDRVALMTLHCAKGLEFENVFIVGLEDGILPHERTAQEDDQIEEERRLFFVGMTRAKSRLFISFAQYRTIRGQLLRSIPSPFLYELGIDLLQTSRSEGLSFQDDDSIEKSIMPLFVPGQKVKHKTFGSGKVIEFVDMGENSIVVVKFNSGQTKSLMLKYANLSII